MANPRSYRVPISEKQVLFVHTFLENGGNAAAAARVAYPNGNTKTAGVLGNKLLKHPRVAEAIEIAEAKSRVALGDISDRYALTAARVAEALARLAFTELRQVLTVETVKKKESGEISNVQRITVRDFDKIDGDAHQALLGVEYAKDGSIKYILPDKRQALLDLARMQGWMKGDDKPAGEREKAGNQQLVMLKIER